MLPVDGPVEPTPPAVRCRKPRWAEPTRRGADDFSVFEAGRPFHTPFSIERGRRRGRPGRVTRETDDGSPRLPASDRPDAPGLQPGDARRGYVRVGRLAPGGVLRVPAAGVGD